MNTHAAYNKRHVVVTLELDVYNDFDPQDIDFADMLRLEADERCDVHVQEIDTPEWERALYMWQLYKCPLRSI